MKKILILIVALAVFAQALVAQTDTKRAARDASFMSFVEKLPASSTAVVEYPGLLAAAAGYKVVVLGGYSGLGYEDPVALRGDIKQLLAAKGDRTMYVIGATGDGIGAAYKWIRELARELGFADIRTAGIVSRNAWEYGIESQDLVVFVDTPVDDWNVMDGGKSMMVNLAADTHGEMIYFRGGAVCKAELEEALARNVKVTIVADPASEPNKKNVAKKLASNPNYVVDGTSALTDNPSLYPTLKVMRDGTF